MIEITDEMVEAYMYRNADDWRKISERMRAVCRAWAREGLEHAAAVLAPAIAAAEREECARIAAGHAATGVASVAADLSGPEYSSGVRDASERIARAIRARGETK